MSDPELSIDVESLIYAVQAHPVLWDIYEDCYKDKYQKKEAWGQVCCCIFEDFEERSTEGKIAAEKAVVARWRSARDGYVKAKRKEKALQKMGAKKWHRYVYADQLSFLDRCLDIRDVDEAVASSSEQGGLEETEYADYGKTDSISSMDRPVKKQKPHNADERDMRAQFSSHFPEGPNLINDRRSSLENDEDMAFFLSILPTVRRLDQSSKFDFRIKVMGYLRDLVLPSNTHQTPASSAFTSHHFTSSPKSDDQYQQVSASTQQSSKFHPDIKEEPALSE